MIPIRHLLVVLMFLLWTQGAQAVTPEEMLDDPTLEARARALSATLRCVVCQNQSIDDSNADIARDLRVLVRKRLMRGETDQEVMDYIVSRYGDFVLLKPPLKETTIVLWAGPMVILMLGLAGIVFMYRKTARASGDEDDTGAVLSTAEREALEKLLRQEDRS